MIACDENKELFESGEVIIDKIHKNKRYIDYTEQQIIAMKIGIDIAKNNIISLQKQMTKLLKDEIDKRNMWNDTTDNKRYLQR